MYFVLLPQPAAFATVRLDAYDFIADSDDDNSDDETQDQQNRPLASSSRVPDTVNSGETHLSLTDKLRLLKPLLIPFCLPLFSVYFAEYTINQGKWRALQRIQYPESQADFPPNRRSVARADLSGAGPSELAGVGAVDQEVRWELDHTRLVQPALTTVLNHSLRDYYPLYQLIYQTFVFISRSSLSLFHLPPLPMSLLPVPSLIQLSLLAITSLESATGFISTSLGDSTTTWIVFALISLEGLCGGSAYVNAYYHLGQQMDDEDDHVGTAKDSKKVAQEREFRIASVGVFDTLGILMAAGSASFLEPRLCRAQQERGKTLCIGL